MRTRIPRAEVPREDPVFKAELERFLAAQRDPGPPQPGHGTSARKPGQPMGRHARTHGKGGKGGKGGGGGGKAGGPSRKPKG